MASYLGEEMELSDWYPRLMADPRVTAIQYSAMRDDNTCEHCQALDGVAFAKEAWLRVEPPTACLHGEECRCMGIGILADESPQPTIVEVEGLASLGVTRADGGPV